ARAGDHPRGEQQRFRVADHGIVVVHKMHARDPRRDVDDERREAFEPDRALRERGRRGKGKRDAHERAIDGPSWKLAHRSKSVASTITPRVPSDPTRSLSRSYPATFLTTRPPARAIVPSVRAVRVPMRRSRTPP